MPRAYATRQHMPARNSGLARGDVVGQKVGRAGWCWPIGLAHISGPAAKSQRAEWDRLGPAMASLLGEGQK
jgi:hypothetical protein